MVGTTISHYKVLEKIGEGGMGEVYRATDTKLNRDVALKILPQQFASDSQRMARFQREAEVLASLDHPNIGQIYGIEEAGQTKALVLQLIEGPTLAERIAQGPIPVEDALKIALQMAEGLEAAHEKGVIHRDLKPANVKITPEGQVKILDFGLAKALEGETPVTDISQSSTLTEEMTRAGVILGTAAYMSPEQARGKLLDKRTDIWAFGVVLFEMLTGKPAFGTDEVSDTLAFVLTKDLDWRALPAETPPTIRHLLERCMDKDAKRRLRDIGEARLVLDGGMETGSPWEKEVETGEGRWRSWRVWLPWAVAAVALLVAGVASGPRDVLAPDPPAARFPVEVTGKLPLRQGHLLALSPDGRELVYRAFTEEGDQLYRRPMNALESVAVRGSEGAGNPFFSPDGQSFGFAMPDGLKRVSLSGGPPQTICTCLASGATWGPDQTIVFTDLSTYGLARVPSTGGDPEPVTTLQTGEIYHDEPSFLPGGDAVLFTIWSGSLATAQVAVVSLETGEIKVLGDGFYPRYSPTGHLLYAQTGAAMWAVPFDESRLEITGDAVPVLEGVRIEGGSSVQFALADIGLMAYIPGGNGESARSLVWVDREGVEDPIPAEPLAYGGVQISPDGMRIALVVEDQESLEDLWMYDVDRETTTQFTLDPAADRSPLWTPDGQSLVFRSDRKGMYSVFRRLADGTGQTTLIAELPGEGTLTSVSPDGETLVYEEWQPETGSDIKQISLVGEPNPQSVLASDASERHARISPDGRWLAYSSDELGQREVFVRPFPNVADGGPWRVSQSGGAEPIWSPDGTDIYYRQGNTVLAASVETAPAFVTTRRQELFSGPYQRSTGFHSYSYDISPDGERFLMIRESEDDARGSEIIVVQDWFEELKRLVPT